MSSRLRLIAWAASATATVAAGHFGCTFDASGLLPLGPSGSGSAAGGSAGSGGAGSSSVSSGGGTVCSMPSDCPGMDTDCRFRTCDIGICNMQNAMDGAPCDELGGNTCANGVCVRSWQAISSNGAPSPRWDHTAVWTGTEMVVWGGQSGPGQVFNTGARYDPQANAWQPMTSMGAPEARHSHGAVWTGDRMVVFGGFGAATYASEGAAYFPSTDTWVQLPPTGPTLARAKHAMVWSGNVVIIWGGERNGVPLADGLRYFQGTNTWSTVQTGGAPTARFDLQAAWVPPAPPNAVDGALVVFGGTDTFNWLQDGMLFDPVANVWLNPPISGAGTPPGHGLAAATTVSVGDDVFIFGGWDGGNFYGEGFDFSATQQPGGVWTRLSSSDRPSARVNHAAVALGEGFFVWGGCPDNACSAALGDGAYWKPNGSTGMWTVVPLDANLSARTDHTLVWTGTEAIEWGGRIPANSPLGDGGRIMLPAN